MSIEFVEQLIDQLEETLEAKKNIKGPKKMQVSLTNAYTKMQNELDSMVPKVEKLILPVKEEGVLIVD